MNTEIRIGASGFSYKEWLGHFYPAKLSGAKMLAYYAERLPAVEINYTFRRMPKASTFEGWTQKTPPNFRFALKASQRITHFDRLRGTQSALDYFIEVAGALRDRLGPVLFQLPPDLPRDDELLTDFLDEIGGRVRATFEFRNRSWFNDRVLEILRTKRAALCIAESEKLASPVECTAPFAYLRLRNETYDDAGLELWASRIRALAEQAQEIYVFFKHESAAPDLANRLAAMLKTGDSAE
ncbi:MAG TPA: DUF72 domain-containing protein [Candidatus Binataceae bacterium]|jgi:uncharacterized protein YecE (DUF72 family)